jgi:hypothetical protein
LLYGTLLLLQMRVALLLVYLLGHSLSLYIIVAFFRALLSVKVGHCRVCSIDVTFLVCSWRSGQIFFALILVFVCSERCVGPIPYRHIQATVLQALNSKYISSFWGNDLGSAGSKLWWSSPFCDLVDVDIPAETLLDGNPEVFGRFHFF